MRSADASNGNPLEREIPRNERWRKFGARNVLGRINLVSSSSLVVDESERDSSLGKDPSMGTINLFR